MAENSSPCTGARIREFSEPIDSILDRIKWNLNSCSTQKGLGGQLLLSQPSVCVLLQKLRAGEICLAGDLQKELQVLNERAVLEAWRFPRAIYQCDLPNVRHPNVVDRAEAANAALCEKLGSDGPLKLNPLVDADIFIRSVPMPHRAWCHTFVNHKSSAASILILINSSMQLKEQCQIAWMAAHREAGRKSIPELRSLIREVSPTRQHLDGPSTQSTSSLKLSRDELRVWVHTAVNQIERAFHWTQVELGHAFGVSQPTFSRRYTAWTEGWGRPTEEELHLLKELHFDACGKLLGFEKLVHRTSYPLDCACEPPDLADVLSTVLYPKEGAASPARRYFVDVHVRSADLSPATRAHCFGNRKENSDAFIVMVNRSNQSSAEQESSVWDEIAAHVAPPETPQHGRVESLIRVR